MTAVKTFVIGVLAGTIFGATFLGAVSLSSSSLPPCSAPARLPCREGAAEYREGAAERT